MSLVVYAACRGFLSRCVTFDNGRIASGPHDQDSVRHFALDRRNPVADSRIRSFRNSCCA